MYMNKNSLQLNVVKASMLLLLCLAPAVMPAQTATEQVPVGNDPRAVAINPSTNKIYVANFASDTVTVIDGATGNPTFIPAGAGPDAVAINTVTNKIYVANGGPGGTDVTVIDGVTNMTSSVIVGRQPVALAVNPVTNKIYVASLESNTVTVIDGATNAISTVAVGASPAGVAVNPVINRIYVSNYTGNNVTVIDGATQNTTTISVGTNPDGVAVNPVTNQVYVANTGSGNVTVIDGATNTTTTVAAGSSPYAVAINTVSNKTYVANIEGGSVTVIDGASNEITTIPTGINPGSFAVNTLTNQIYVADQSSEDVVAIDGASSTVTSTLAIGGIVTALAVNPVTNRIYAANLASNSFGSNNVAVIDGSTNGYGYSYSVDPLAGGGVGAGGSGVASAVNPVTNKIYVANVRTIFNQSGSVTVIDGATNAITTVAASYNESYNAVAVNPITDKIYVAGDSGITVIDGATNSITTIAVGGVSKQVEVNPVTNKIYVASTKYSAHDIGPSSGAITVIDGATNATTTIPVGYGYFERQDLAVNPVTNKVYVIDLPGYFYDQEQQVHNTPGSVTVIDGATNATSTVSVGPNPDRPLAVAVNPVTNRVYIAEDGPPIGWGTAMPGSVTVIDGATNAALTSIGVGVKPIYVAINLVTNKIYVSNWLGSKLESPILTVIDGYNNASSTIALPSGFVPFPLAVNSAKNIIYAGIVGVIAIDGISNTTTSIVPGNTFLLLPIGPYSLAVNPVTGKVYAWGFYIIPQQVVPNTLNATVAPLPGNVTSNPSPTFDFTTWVNFAPIAPPVQNVYYQLDTEQGPWTPATGLASSFTGQLSNVQLGSHVLYYYATDAADSTDLAIGANSIGAISAYPFTVVNP